MSNDPNENANNDNRDNHNERPVEQSPPGIGC